MQRIRAGSQRGAHDRLPIKEVRSVGAVRRRDDDAKAEPLAGATDPTRDLTAIGHEQRV